MVKKSSTAAKPVEEDEDEVELEELEEDADEAPAKGKSKAKPAEDEIWGVRSLIALVKKETGKEYTPREVRTLLRTLARAGTIDREVIAGNKTRYEWSGPADPEVKAVLKAIKSGKIEESKKAALQKLKDDKAKKTAAAKAAETKATGSKKKKAAPPPDEDEDEDEETDED